MRAEPDHNLERRVRGMPRSQEFSFGIGWALALLSAVIFSTAAPAQAKGPQQVTLPAPDSAAIVSAMTSDYRIGPLDTLEITVFGVDQLNRTVQVDAAGQIDFPLIGQVAAVAKTSRELGQDIGGRLGARYLQAPQVSVLVKASMTQRFTIEGSVGSPGVYDLPGRMSLLQAIATAKGLDNVADPRNVVVFRTVEGRRRAGVADFAAIRSGRLADPEIYAGDVIVVGNSRAKGWLRNVIGVTPLFNLLLL